MEQPVRNRFQPVRRRSTASRESATTVVNDSAWADSGAFSTLGRGLIEADGPVAVIFITPEIRLRFGRCGQELAGGQAEGTLAWKHETSVAVPDSD